MCDSELGAADSEEVGAAATWNLVGFQFCEEKSIHTCLRKYSVLVQVQKQSDTRVKSRAKIQCSCLSTEAI